MKRPFERRADPYRDTAVIDTRAPRVNQAVVGIFALVAVVTGWWLLLALLALQLALGLTLGRRWCLACVFYYEVLQPRFGEGPLEDSRPPRFANVIGLGFLGAASIAYLVGWTTLGTVLGGIVAALALLAAVAGVCTGCYAYKVLCALTGRRFVSCPCRRSRATRSSVLGETPVQHDAPAVRVGDRDAAPVPVRVLRLDVGVAHVGEAARDDLCCLLRLDVEDEQVVLAGRRARATVGVRGELEVVVAAGQSQEDAVVAGVPLEATELLEAETVLVERDALVEPVRRTRPA